MDIRTGLLIAIFLGLLGAFFSIRAGSRSIQTSRRLASWPERRKKVAAGRVYYWLAFLLIVLSITGGVFALNGKNASPPVPSTQVASLERTATIVPTAAQTNTPAGTGLPALTDTPTMPATLAQTFTPTIISSQVLHPTDTHWATWTASRTPTATSTRTQTRTPTMTSTLFPTRHSHPDRYPLGYLDAEQDADGHPDPDSNPNPHALLHALPDPDSHPDRYPLAGFNLRRHPVKGTKGMKDA